MSRAVSAFVAAALLVACGKTERQIERRREAERMVYAVESLRSAPNEAKPPHLKALQNVECNEADVCELRRACVEAYEVHLRALTGARAARHAIESDAGERKKAAELLGQSAKFLEQATEKTKQCADLEGEVVRRYKLN